MMANGRVLSKGLIVNALGLLCSATVNLMS